MTLSSKKLWLAAATAIFMLAVAGCNDTLRQFIIPIPKPGGDPGSLANAIVLSTNPATPTSNGSTQHIDVSGDTIVGQVTTGPNPVFFGIASNRMFVINGDNTITSYIALLPTVPPISTVVLSPPPPCPTPPCQNSVAGGTSSSGNFFTANSLSNNSSVVNSSLLAETTTVTVGTNPVSIAGNSANSKIYVVNRGTNDVTVISTTDNTVIKLSIPVGSQPIWGVMSANGADVFVVNQGDGTLSVIDTATDKVITTVDLDPSGSPSATLSPNFAAYESNRQRLYVSNTGLNSNGDNTVSVIKADGADLNATPPVLLKAVKVSGAPVSVAALPDGSKAYAALGGCPAGTNHTNLVTHDTVTGIGPNLPSCTGKQVSVIDANALVEKTTIPVGPGVVSVATSSSSLRAYAVSAHDITTVADNVHAPNCTSNCIPGSVQPPRSFSTPSIYDIKTATDTVIPRTTDPSVTPPVATFLAPSQDPNCTPAVDPSFNSSVPLPVCVGQIPFMVRTFP